MEIILDNSLISSIDFNKLEPFLNAQSEPFLPLVVKETSRGGDYYRTLAYIANHFQNSLIFDIGSGHGFSALALSFEQSNRVISYDLDRSRGLEIKEKEKGNIKFLLGDALSDQVLTLTSIIYLDTYHDGEFERKVIERLIKEKWQGLLIMDDILDYPGLKVVWEDISLPKYNITKYGHFSGFGIVLFGKDIEIKLQ